MSIDRNSYAKFPNIMLTEAWRQFHAYTRAVNHTCEMINWLSRLGLKHLMEMTVANART